MFDANDESKSSVELIAGSFGPVSSLSLSVLADASGDGVSGSIPVSLSDSFDVSSNCVVGSA